MKAYKAILFDWDGTAVISRRASADSVISIMKKLLQKKIYLVIISGTTYENIAGGKLEEYFTKEEGEYLLLGLGRGAYNYCFDEKGIPTIFHDEIPNKENLLKIHKACFDIHTYLLEKYDWNTDIVFSRPNYCKIDLLVERDRGENLFLQEGETEQLKAKMSEVGYTKGILGLLALVEEIGEKYGLEFQVTSDAKFLEVGISNKSNNVNTILEYLNKKAEINASQCCFWGDEYVAVEEGIYGSDSFMLTEKSCEGDFFDVSESSGVRFEKVKILGGGVLTFLNFLTKQAEK